jgi:hypothetical protein
VGGRGARPRDSTGLQRRWRPRGHNGPGRPYPAPRGAAEAARTAGCCRRACARCSARDITASPYARACTWPADWSYVSEVIVASEIGKHTGTDPGRLSAGERCYQVPRCSGTRSRSGRVARSSTPTTTNDSPKARPLSADLAITELAIEMDMIASGGRFPGARRLRPPVLGQRAALRYWPR